MTTHGVPGIATFGERLADPHAAPGAGSASAVVVEMAAALVVKAASRSAETWPDADEVTTRARALGSRSAELSEIGSRAFDAALHALEQRTGIEQHLAASLDVLLELAETAADVAELAALTAERCDGTFRGDAICAALLAEAAACSAAVLVAGNLTVSANDPRLARAKRLGELSTASVRRALESGT